MLSLFYYSGKCTEILGYFLQYCSLLFASSIVYIYMQAADAVYLSLKLLIIPDFISFYCTVDDISMIILYAIYNCVACTVSKITHEWLFVPAAVRFTRTFYPYW